jgi:polysaccharide chain length determinant protein (PEP-CTERM system associated)
MPRANDPRADSKGIDFALEVWQRRKWLALAIFIVVFAGAATFTMSLPDLYQATASVLVERQHISEAFVRPSVTTELETRIQTIHKQVTSRARLADVITRFNLYPELRGQVPMEAIVDRMRRDIQFGLSGVQPGTGRAATIAFTLNYTGRDPYTVADVANTLVASYVDENTKTREEQASRTAGFLKTQLDDAKRELDAHQQREREFTAEHTVELPQQVDVNLAALDRLNTQLRMNGEYQLRAIERRERLEHQLADADANGNGSVAAAPESREAQLKALQQHLVDLQMKFSDQYPDVIQTKRKLAALERAAEAPVEIRSNGSGNPRPVSPTRRLTEQALLQVQNELNSLKQEERLLRKLTADYEGRVENAPRRQDELRRLSQDYVASKERYDTLLKRYEEAKVAETLEQGRNVEQFRVLDPAVPSIAPVAPNRLWLLLMSFAGSLALAFAAVIAAERIDTSFHSVDELRAFVSVPTLAVIRRIPTRAETRGQRLRFAVTVVAALVGLAVMVLGARYVGTDNEQVVRMTARGRA